MVEGIISLEKCWECKKSYCNKSLKNVPWSAFCKLTSMFQQLGLSAWRVQ